MMFLVLIKDEKKSHTSFARISFPRGFQVNMLMLILQKSLFVQVF